MRKRLYAIKHTPTGGFLPELGGQRAGYTHTEPEPPATLYGSPRLFQTKGGARRALRWWLKGVTSVTFTKPEAWGGDYDVEWHEEAKPNRKEEDMEIVTMLLSEIPSD